MTTCELDQYYPDVISEAFDKIDQLELAMLANNDKLIELPLEHRFTPGLYSREIFIPAGTLVTSKIHRTEHQFILLEGTLSVSIPGKDPVCISAPYVGVTEAGTRRVVLAHTDVRWITFHANPENDSDPDVIESKIIERRELSDGTTVNERYLEALVKLLPEQTDYVGAP